MFSNRTPDASASDARSGQSGSLPGDERKPYTAPSLTHLGTVADRTADYCFDFTKGMPVPCS